MSGEDLEPGDAGNGQGEDDDNSGEHPTRAQFEPSGRRNLRGVYVQVGASPGDLRDGTHVATSPT
ncbi:MAG: hypothetical protein H0T54_06110 [Geodermatophilaceae bacterium]|nr:hypothetical protein [Geodermatophilaceae bacterium]